ncbi:MAG: DUF3047 domain-containing protein [Gammaproteobacteria bacterium]|nr:DUF3047 domain-containing protein [Gammaproteobacteria bacterium]
MKLHNLLFIKPAYTRVIILCGWLFNPTAICFAETTTVKALTLPDISQWKTETFSGKTTYEVVNIDQRNAIKAVSRQSASGLVRKMPIDLAKTPYMNWSWKVENVLTNVDEQQKSGDDYAARVYVVISGGLLFWRTRAISYVWASHQAQYSHWPNAFTGNAIMVSVQSGPGASGQWVTEKRNVLEDIKQLLGVDNTEIDAVAIMSDADNSQQSATAYYGDIYFTAQ